MAARLPLARLLLVGALVPCVFSAVDHWLLSRLAENPTDRLHIGLTMGAFVVQIGVLGILCGHWLDDPRWRWGVYLWGWLLIDVQLLSALVFVAGTSDWTNAGYLLVASLFAAQVGLTIIWAILGTTRWALRLPICGVLATLLALPIVGSYGFAGTMFPVQVTALLVLCLVLRWMRYRLDLIATVQKRVASASQRALQFGVRHVLIWTTSLAVVLGALRALDLLSWRALAPFFQGGLAMLTAGILVATVFIVALWAALGAGPVWLRWPTLAVTMVMVGSLLALFAFFDRNGTIALLARNPATWDSFWRYDGWLLAWVALAGSLLFASLLILRVRGWRLVRAARQFGERGA